MAEDTIYLTGDEEGARREPNKEAFEEHKRTVGQALPTAEEADAAITEDLKKRDAPTDPFEKTAQNIEQDTYFLGSLDYDDDMTSIFMEERERVHSQQQMSGMDRFREEMRAEEEAAIDAKRPEGSARRIAGAAWNELRNAPTNFAASARSYLENEMARSTDPKNKENFRELIEVAQNVEDYGPYQKDPEFEGLTPKGTLGFLEDVARGITGSLPDMYLTIAMPPVGMAAMFAHIQGSSYGDMEDRIREEFPKMSEEDVKHRALVASTVNAAVQTPLELVGNLVKIKAVFGNKGFRKILGRVAESAFGEGITEYVQQFPEEFAMIWALNPDLTRKEFFAHIKEQQENIRKKALYSGAVGAAAGVGTTGVGGVATTGVEVVQYVSAIQKEKNAIRDKVIQDKLASDELITEEVIAPKVEEDIAPKVVEEERASDMTIDIVKSEEEVPGTEEGEPAPTDQPGKELTEEELFANENEKEINDTLDKMLEEKGPSPRGKEKRTKEISEELITKKIKDIQEANKRLEDMTEDHAVFTSEAIPGEVLEKRKKFFEEAETGPDLVDKVANEEEFKTAEKKYEDEAANDEEFQSSTVSQEEQVNNLADDLNVNREDYMETMARELEERKDGDPVNKNKIQAWTQLHKDSFQNVKNKWNAYLEHRKFFPEKESEESFNTSLEVAKMAAIKASDKHTKIVEKLKKVGTTAGEALQEMDMKNYTYREASARMRKDYLDSEVRRLYDKVGVDKVAKQIATLESAYQLNNYDKKIRRIGIGDMLLEVWISALLSNPTTHSVNFITNTLVDVMAVPERYMGSLSSIIRRGDFYRKGGTPKEFADTKDPKQMAVEEGEATALFYGLGHGVVEAIQVFRAGVGEFFLESGKIDFGKVWGKIQNENQVRIDDLNFQIKKLEEARGDGIKDFRKKRTENIAKYKSQANHALDIQKEHKKRQLAGVDLKLRADIKGVNSSNKSSSAKAKSVAVLKKKAAAAKISIAENVKSETTRIRKKRKTFTDKAWVSSDKEIQSLSDAITELENQVVEIQTLEGMIGADNTKLERMRTKTISSRGARDIVGSTIEYFGSEPLPDSFYNLAENPTTGLLKVAEQGLNFFGFMMRIPSSMLLVSDKVFKNAVGYRMNLRALAYRTAMQEGRVGKEQSKRIQEIMENPEEHAPEVLEEAHEQAAYQVFVNKLGSFGNQFEKALGSHKAAKVIIPFLRTPVNILKFGLERTPLMLFEKNFWADLKAGGARADMAMGKVAAGSTIAAVFAGMALSGLVTGSGPPDPDLRNLKRNQGWQPYSFKFNNTYYSYSRLEPFGMMMGAIADGVDLMGELNEGDTDRLTKTLIFSFANNFTSKTWCRSVSEFVGVMNNQNRYSATYVHKLLSSFIPMSSGLSQAKKVGIPGYYEADKKLRDIRIKDRENTFAVEQYYKVLDTMKSRLPGWSKDLHPRLNLWGEEITLGGGFGPEAISPIYTNEVKYSPVDAEMYRLGIESDHHFQMPEANLDIQGVSVELTDNEYHYFLKAMNARGVLDKGLTLKESIGQEVELFGKFGYGDEERFNIISGQLEMARAIAKEDLFESFPDVETYVRTKEKERNAKNAVPTE